MEIILRDILPSDALSLAHILVEANNHTFRGLVPDHCLEFPIAESAANWTRTLTSGLPAGDLMTAATSHNAVIGYAWAGLNHKDSVYQAELRQLMILPAYQRQGIGKRLVSHAAQRLLEQNLGNMRVEVLQINPNRAFYEHVGAHYVSDYPYDWDGVMLPMCVYGWDDLRLLTETVD